MQTGKLEPGFSWYQKDSRFHFTLKYVSGNINGFVRSLSENLKLVSAAMNSGRIDLLVFCLDAD